MMTRSKPGLYQNAQSASYLPLTLATKTPDIDIIYF